MRQKIFTFGFTFALLAGFGCKQENAKTAAAIIPECLQQKIDNHQSNYPSPFEKPATLTKYRYQNQEVYIFDPDPAHSHIRDWMYKAVDANCTEVCNFGGGFANLPSTCPDFDEKAVKLEVIWTHQ